MVHREFALEAFRLESVKLLHFYPNVPLVRSEEIVYESVIQGSDEYHYHNVLSVILSLMDFLALSIVLHKE